MTKIYNHALNLLKNKFLYTNELHNILNHTNTVNLALLVIYQKRRRELKILTIDLKILCVSK